LIKKNCSKYIAIFDRYHPVHKNSGDFVPLRYRTRRLRTTPLERSYHI